MMDWHVLGTVVVVYSVGVISPGPNFVAVVHRAVTAPRIEAIALVVGVVLANGLWASAAILGVGGVIGLYPWVLGVLRIGGALYLIWFGGKLILRAGDPLSERAMAQHDGVVGAVRVGVTTNLSNPKSLAFYGSIFSTIVPGRIDPATAMAMVAVVIVIGTIWYGAVALGVSTEQIASRYRRGKAVIERSCGAILIAFGAKLALSR
jgi:threonine efflux protein